MDKTWTRQCTKHSQKVTMVCMTSLPCEYRWMCPKCVPKHQDHIAECLSMHEFLEKSQVLQEQQAAENKADIYRQAIESLAKAKKVINHQINALESAYKKMLTYSQQSEQWTLGQNIDRISEEDLLKCVKKTEEQDYCCQLVSCSVLVQELAEQFQNLVPQCQQEHLEMPGQIVLEGQCWKNARFGQWNYSLNGEIISAGKYLQGKKTGAWNEIMHVDKFRHYTLFEQGEYLGGVKNGKWIIRDGKQTLGGGIYVNGVKEGSWVEVKIHSAKSEILVVLRQGEYLAGVRVGNWIFNKDKGSKIGGGAYESGIKCGKWTELQVYSSQFNTLLLNEGEYKDGVKINKWVIKREKGEIIGGGDYVDGLKQNKWVEVDVHGSYWNVLTMSEGEYDKDKRVNKWVIKREKGEQIGGGQYIDGLQNGKWIEVEVHSSGYEILILLWEGEYRQGIKANRWVVKKLEGDILGGGVYWKGQKEGKWTEIDVQCSKLEIQKIINETTYKQGMGIGQRKSCKVN